jgi:hypothetical protein
VKSTFKRHVVSLKWKMGQKEIKIAVSVDRTRDLQIFSLTLSQLSYPRLLDKVVNLFFQSMFFPFQPLPHSFYLFPFCSSSLGCSVFLSLSVALRERGTRKRRWGCLSRKSSFSVCFQFFIGFFYLLVLCVYSFCLKRFFLSLESTCRAEIRGIT